MAQISTIGKNKFSAMFNRRHLSITNDGQVKAVEMGTGEIIGGAELRSIRNLLEWHIKSKRTTSELPVLWTVQS